MADRDPNTRIGDDEREEAVQALGIHYAKGRIELGEYETRCDQAYGSQTVQDLDQVFADLPLPHYGSDLAVYSPAQSPETLGETAPVSGTGIRKPSMKRWMEVGWTLSGFFVFFGFATGIGTPFVPFIPLVLMTVLSILFEDDDDEDDEDEENDDTDR